MDLEALIDRVKNEYPDLGLPIVKDGVASWRIPTGWTFLAREATGLYVTVSKGDRPAAWIPMTENEAIGCLGWFMKRRR